MIQGQPASGLAKAPIEIPYRTDGFGKGAYYDNKTVRETTGHETVVSIPSGYTRSDLDSFNTGLAWSKDVVMASSEQLNPLPAVVGLPEPISAQPPSSAGLLVVTGQAPKIRDLRFHEARLEHERKILRHAFNTGRPVLGICAGSWKLASSHVARLTHIENAEASFVDAPDHNQGSSTLFDVNGRIVNNIQVHRVMVGQGTLLAQAMFAKGVARGVVPVNSIHWKALDASKLPDTLKTCASSVADSSLQAREQKTQKLLHPAEDCVEAFESQEGAPILGIQWHPEAYRSDDPGFLYPQAHRNIMQYMAAAGDTWNAKRQVLSELHRYFASQLR